MALKAILLGTGGPKPDPDRCGPAVLVKVQSQNYLFDMGRGVTMRLVQAGVKPQDLDAVFITHHHFDHISDLGDLLLSIWNSGRSSPLPVFGPHGTKSIIKSLLTGVYSADIDFRYKEAKITGDHLCNIDELIKVIEIDTGPVFESTGCDIVCERVEHGHGLGMTHDEWPCLGYRISSGGKTIAISGDTVDCDGLEKLANRADLLVLCCYLADDEQNEFERNIVSKHILVSSAQAGKIARRCHVKTLALTHIRQKSPAMLGRMQADIRKDYTGVIIVGADLLDIPL